MKLLKRYPAVLWFLLSRLLYNDGLVTIFAFGGIYASTVFGFSNQDILIFGIALNFAAGLGAFLFAHFDDRFGPRLTINLSLIALSGATLLAVVGQSPSSLWLSGIVIGLFAGPNQSASRSLFSHMVPEQHRTELFGLYAMSGKMTTFLGPLCLGLLTDAFSSMRAGVAAVIVFFILGALLLQRVPKRSNAIAA
ncbi:MAG: MFS transporter [Myxococcales bacterium]|nr:MAG: MFS transporter [Myxococcales bacterium]